MSNLTELAFPLIEESGTKQSISTGLTKHEYAAILIAGHLSGEPSFIAKSPDHIANEAYKIAKAVLSKFEKTLQDGSIGNG